MRRFVILPILVLALALGAESASADPGSLDTSFGAGGIVGTMFGANPSEAGGMALQADGKIVVAGTSGNTPTEFAIARYNIDGSLDSSFDGDGKKLVNVPNYTNGTSRAVAIQPDGGILVAGRAQVEGISFLQDIVFRLTPAGALDGSFGSGDGSFAAGSSGSTPIANAIVTLPDGSFLEGVTELNGAADVLVYKASKTGFPDGTFGGGDAEARIDWGPNAQVLHSLDRDSSGGILVGGTYASTANGVNPVVSRLSSAGVVDSGFAGAGKYEAQSPGDQVLTSAKFTPDGKIVFVFNSADLFSVNRLTGGGVVDASFGTGGSATGQAGSLPTAAEALAVQPDGKIALAGWASYGSANALMTARFTSAGQKDAAFGASGLALINPNPTGRTGRAIVIQPDTKIVVAGSEAYAGFSLARYVGDAHVPVPLGVAINKLKSKIKAKKFKSISGTAAGDGLAKVQVAIQRIDSKLLKKKKRCKWVKSTSGKTKSVKAVKKKCSAPGAWLTAAGTTTWKLKLKKTLPVGKYVIYVRAVAADGSTQTVFSKTLGNRISLTLSK